MASSAKLRISSRRTSTSPPIDEDILASSSAGWKAVALPEPARMVSLPAIDQLPSVEEVKSERKSKKELKAERTSASKIAAAAIAVETAPISSAISPAPVAKPALEAKPDVADAAAVRPIIGARFAQQQKKSGSRGGLYAAIGVGLAAAAGVGWYVSTQMGDKPAAQIASNEGAADRAELRTQSMAAGSAAPAAPTVEPIVVPPAEPEKAADTVVTGIAQDGAAAAPGGDSAKADEGAKRGKGTGQAKKKDDKDRDATLGGATDKKVEAPKVEKPADKKAEGGEGEPSFDALLKEAGVQDKKPAKVALEKKSLSGTDIKKGMSSVGGKAQACYAGTQGTAQVKLTVAPDGSVSKVAVTGVFAGTPVGACVEAAVKGASFPAWDGGPQSFGYSYLLAE